MNSTGNSLIYLCRGFVKKKPAVIVQKIPSVFLTCPALTIAQYPMIHT